MSIPNALAGRRLWLLGVASLAALLALAAAALGPAQQRALADGHDTLPPNLAFSLNLINESDNIVPAGSELTVAAAITYDGAQVGGGIIEAPAADKAGGLSGTEASLRLSGSFEWESAEAIGSRLNLGDIELSSANAGIDEATDAIGGKTPASGNADLANSDVGLLEAVAWDGRTLIARSNGVESTIDDRVLQIYDTASGTPVWKAVIGSPVAGENASWMKFGLGPAGGAGSGAGEITPGFGSVAVWHETPFRAWLFVGAEEGKRGYNMGGTTNQKNGALYIYRLDYINNELNLNADGTVTFVARMQPPGTEIENRLPSTSGYSNHYYNLALYGSSVAISADGSTLVVSARQINNVGAVYVYTRPTGANSWQDLTYASGVKVSPVAIPTWGTRANSAHRPFDNSSSTNCAADSYCARVSAASVNTDTLAATGLTRTMQSGNFGIGKIGISADGSVIAVGAPTRQFPDSTVGGSFTSGTNQGIVYVFEAPSGGWGSVPDFTTGKTAVATGTDASSFTETGHYSPGPAKRVVEATATLRQTSSWTGDAEHFGTHVDISADGSTIAVASGSPSLENIFNHWQDRANAYIFERDGDSWSDSTSPAATFTLSATTRNDAPWGFDLNPAGDTLAFGQRTYSSNAGRTVVIKKGSGWSDATIPTGAITQTAAMWQLTQPIDPATGRATRFGAPLYDLDGNRFIVSAPGTRATSENPGELWNWHAQAVGAGCAERTYDDVTTTSCTIAVPSDGKVVIPAGSPDGVFTISGSVKLTSGTGDDAPTTTVRRSLEVTVGKVQEVATVNLAIPPRLNDLTISTDDDNPPWPTVLRTDGDSTRIMLSILNAGGTASAAGSVASVLVTSSAGELGIVSASGNATSSSCSGLSCQIDVSSINAGNANRIMLSLTHKGRAGNARVSASVQSRETGEALRPDPLEIVLAGPADKIIVADPAVGVLNVDQADTDDEGNDVDTVRGYTQDELLLAVSAQDKAGNFVAVPRATSGRAVLKDAAGALVRSGATATFPARWNAAESVSPGCVTTAIADTTTAFVACRAADGSSVATPDDVNPAIITATGLYQVKVDVDAAPTSPLKAGAYTVEVTAGGKTASATFNVSGGAAADGVSLDAPTERVALSETFTVTANVNDADGNPVPDGTAVNWINPQTTSGAGRDTLVVSTTMTELTKDGKATNTYLVVGSGTVVLRATAGAGSDAAVVTVGGVLAPPTPANPADYLRSRNPNDLTTWLGQGRTSASALLNGLDGIGFILLWLNGEWLRYGLADGRMIPGSTDFTVNPGSVLWLSR